MRLVPWNFTIFLLIKEPIEQSSGVSNNSTVSDDRQFNVLCLLNIPQVEFNLPT